MFLPKSDYPNLLKLSLNTYNLARLNSLLKIKFFRMRLPAAGSHKNESKIIGNKQITREIQRLTHCSRCKSRTDNRRIYAIIARGALPVTFCRVKLSESENSRTGREHDLKSALI